MRKCWSWVCRHPIRIELGSAVLLILLDLLHRFSERIGFPDRLLGALTVFVCADLVFWGILLPVIGIRRIRKHSAASNQADTAMEEMRDFLQLVVLPPLMAITAVLFD